MVQQKPLDESLVVVGLARDCASALPQSLAFCEALEGAFATVDFVFVENGSTDETRGILERWADQRGGATVLDPDGALETDEKAKRIAECRNTALAHVRRELADRRLLLNLDMDIEIGTQPERSVAEAARFLASSPQVVGVFPNSSPLYYDIWALRHPFWCPFDVWQKVDAAWATHSPADENQTPPDDHFVHSRQLHIPVDLAPIKVESAFGGLGLYRLEAALDGVYRGLDDRNQPVCEHVEYNKALDGELYILPSWCVQAPLEHLSSAFRLEKNYEQRLRLIREGRARGNQRAERSFLRSLLARIVR